MPGKVNPVIPEVVNQTCFQIIGGDLTCTHASQAGQLELNVMEPVLIYNCFNNINMFTRATKTLRTLCVDGITADKAQCEKLLHNSIGIVTGLLPYIGYKKCSNASKIAAQTGKSIKDVLVELGYCQAGGRGSSCPREDDQAQLHHQELDVERKTGVSYLLFVGPKSALELEQSIQNHISLNPFSPCFVQVRVLDGCFHCSVLAFPNTHRV